MAEFPLGAVEVEPAVGHFAKIQQTLKICRKAFVLEEFLHSPLFLKRSSSLKPRF